MIDLKKNPEMKDFIVDKEVGDSVCLYGTLKSIDDQTVVVTVDEIEEDKRPAEMNPEGGNEGSGDEGADKRNPQGDAVTQAGATPDAVRDVAGGEMAMM